MTTVYLRSPKIEASAMKAESLLFDPATNKFCLLNETAALVWERLDQPSTADQLAGAVCESFSGVARAQAENDVYDLLRRLESLSFVVIVD